MGQHSCLITEDRDGFSRREIGDVRDQGIERRPALGGIDGRDGVGIARIRSQPIDGLGGQDDQLPGVKGRDGGA